MRPIAVSSRIQLRENGKLIELITQDSSTEAVIFPEELETLVYAVLSHPRTQIEAVEQFLPLRRKYKSSSRDVLEQRIKSLRALIPEPDPPTDALLKPGLHFAGVEFRMHASGMFMLATPKDRTRQLTWRELVNLAAHCVRDKWMLERNPRNHVSVMPIYDSELWTTSGELKCGSTLHTAASESAKARDEAQGALALELAKERLALDELIADLEAREESFKSELAAFEREREEVELQRRRIEGIERGMEEAISAKVKVALGADPPLMSGLSLPPSIARTVLPFLEQAGSRKVTAKNIQVRRALHELGRIIKAQLKGGS